MTSFKDRLPQVSRRGKLGFGAAALLALGAAGGAGAVSLTRPAVEMAPTVTTAIAKLPAGSGIVTVRGRVAEVYGDRFVLQDQTGRTMIDAGGGADASPGVGQTIAVQGRFENGQLHASYLIGQDGKVSAMGPAGGPPHGRGTPERPHHDGPPPPPAGDRDRPGSAPPPAGCDVAGSQPEREQVVPPPPGAPSKLPVE